VQKRFDVVFESALTRNTNGGFLVGDLVTFKKDWTRHKELESQDETLSRIRSMIEQGYNLKVTDIKNRYPAVGGGSNTDYINPASRIVVIAQEIAPGRYYNYLSVPGDILTVVDVYPNLAPIPDKFSRKDGSHIKAKEVKPTDTSDKSMTTPGYQTRLSDAGNKKLTVGDRYLNNTNTAIPSKPAEGSRDPAKYTFNYLPTKR